MKTYLSLLALTLFSFSTSTFAETDQSSVVTANNQFAIKLYEKLNTGDQNIFFSPYSIATALEMLLPGAKDNTLKEIANVLGLSIRPNLNQEILNLINDLNASSTVTLSVANSLWAEKSYPIQQDYLDITKNFFNSEIQQVDFKNNPEAQRTTINQWVSNKTKDKINNLLAEGTVKAATRLILANAIYFLGDWANQFNPDSTYESNFFSTPKDKISLKFMRQSKTFNYFENEELQVVQMPYVRGEFAMEIFLPRNTDPSALEKQINLNKMGEYVKKFSERKVIIQMPRFKAESSFNLSDALGAMGIKDAFKFGPADFSGISGNRELFISDVVHKAFVEVGEKGTEAAAATAIMMEAGAAYHPDTEKPAVFRADHPFVFQIRHLKSGAVLFLGKIVKP